MYINNTQSSFKGYQDKACSAIIHISEADLLAKNAILCTSVPSHHLSYLSQFYHSQQAISGGLMIQNHKN